jgi:hypothetical protein
VQELDTARIRKQLAQLRRLKPAVFGADVHHFQVNPRPRDAEASEFERVHNVKLPLGFRQFLTSVGNGGAGPFYGVGQLWEERRSEVAGLKPLRLGNGSPATFSRWYGEWLEDVTRVTDAPVR